MERFFSPCPRGLEAALGEELARLGAASVAPVDGGVGYEGALDLAYAANLESRIASRVLWRVGGGSYRDEREIHALAKAIDWTRHFRADRTIRAGAPANPGARAWSRLQRSSRTPPRATFSRPERGPLVAAPGSRTQACEGPAVSSVRTGVAPRR